MLQDHFEIPLFDLPDKIEVEEVIFADHIKKIAYYITHQQSEMLLDCLSEAEKQLTEKDRVYFLSIAFNVHNRPIIKLLVEYYLEILGDKASLLAFLWENNISDLLLMDELFEEYCKKKPDDHSPRGKQALKVIAECRTEFFKKALTENRNHLLACLLHSRPLTAAEKSYCISTAQQIGNIAIVELLTGNELYYFQQQTTPEQIGQAVSLAYRFSDMQQVDRCLEKYISYLHSSSKLPQETVAKMIKKIRKQRKNFLSWGPLIASYMTERDLNTLARAYAPGTTISIDTDIALGLSKFQTVDELVKQTPHPRVIKRNVEKLKHHLWQKL